MLKVGIEPQYMHWQLLEKSGLIVAESEQHNLVLTQASELMPIHGMDGITNWAAVGTGSTAPNASQTALAAELVRTNAGASGESDSITRISNGVWDISRVRQFDANQVGNQNLTEWGFAPLSTGNIAIRELFRNAGNPITITPTATQSLRIIYVTRVTLLPVVPQNVSINIAGIGNRTAKLFLVQGNDFDTVNQMIKGNCGFQCMDVVIPVSYTTGAFAQGNNSRITGQFASAYVPNSKTRAFSPVQYSANAFAGDVFGFACRPNSSPFALELAGLICQFDTGQEFTKDFLHSLTVDPFGVSWT